MTNDPLNRFLTVRILYPSPGHKDDILEAVKKVADAARKFEGLVEVGAWRDEQNDLLVNVSLWESKEQAMRATAEMHPLFADIPWNDWQRRPAENFLGLVRVV